MSCVTELSVTPCEQGTAKITMNFLDESGNSVVPYNLSWQLMRPAGTLVNDRSFANDSFTGTEIILTGDDLAIFGKKDTGERVFSVQGNYDSSLGTGLNIRGECTFTISKLLGQVDG